MENRAACRTYGSLDEPATKLRSSSELLSAQATDSLLDNGKQSSRAGHQRDYSRKSWLALVAVCALGVGTIMATNRSGSASSPAVQHPATTASPGGASSGVAETRGSLLEANLPSSAIRTRTSVPAGKPAVSESADELLRFSMTNFYHTRDGKPGALIPWLQGVQLAEPFRDTTMTVENSRDGHDYRWEVRQAEQGNDLLASATGAEATVQFTQLDWNTVHLTELDAGGAVIREMSETVMVKYVRREIRTLTDAERDDLFDAMAELWKVRVTGGNGKEKYGDTYADIWAINRLHFSAAASFTCDHFHDGLGFLTSHSMMTNTFEYSLQTVNPKLTVPYWDFTIESSTMGGNVEGVAESQGNSPLFTPEWFGSHDPEDQQLKDGRWAYTEIPKMVVNNPAGLDADVYSKLRAPWNVNDRPYLSRSLGEMCGFRVQDKYEWPTCASHYDITMSYSDYYSWVWDSLYDPHGPVHVWLGGVLDCDKTYAKVADLVGVDIAEELSYYSFVHRKNLFRGGYFKCVGNAGVDQQPDEVLRSGTCGCLDYNLKTGDDYKTLITTMLFVEDYVGDFDEDTQRSVVDTLCNGIANDGDHLQASSSLDPSFWVTHPTMERLWMFKRLTGTMTDLSWPDTDTTVVDEETGETTSEILSLFDESCNGHRGSDVFPFGLAIDDGDEGFTARTAIKGDEEGGNVLTNREILLALDPRVNKLSYIYDNFDWPHCLEDGVDMNDAWPSTAAESPANAKRETKRSARPTFKEDEIRYPMYKVFKDKAGEVASKKSREL